MKLVLFMVSEHLKRLLKQANYPRLQIMTFCVNAGASASNVFGPIILQELIGVSLTHRELVSDFEADTVGLVLA